MTARRARIGISAHFTKQRRDPQKIDKLATFLLERFAENWARILAIKRNWHGISKEKEKEEPKREESGTVLK